MKKLLLILACSVAFLEVAAQDMIIYKDKTIDEVTIIEVNPDFIKYREYGAPVNSATFSIEKDYLSKIIFVEATISLFNINLQKYKPELISLPF